MNAVIGIQIGQALLLLTAAWCDVASRLIPNLICLALALLGIVGRLFEGPQQLAESFAVAAVLFAFLLSAYARQMIGGGDVKLLVATVLGLPATVTDFIHLVTCIGMIGGALAIAHLVLRRLPRPQLPPIGSSFLRRVYAVERWRNVRHAPLPYGVAIGCGGILAILT